MTNSIATPEIDPAFVDVEPGLIADEMTEYDLIGSVLADPSQWYDCVDIQPHHFNHPSYRAVWSIIYDRKGQVAPAVLFAQLDKSEWGQRAMSDIGGMDGIHRLFRDGQNAGQAEVLAGEIRKSATHRDIERLKNTIRPEQFRDIAEYGSALSAGINGVVARLATKESGSLSIGVQGALKKWHWMQANPGKVLGIRTGMPQYDKAVGGLESGKIYLVGGHSGEGKSQIMVYWALQAAMTVNDLTGERNNVAFFSLEMAEEELAVRLLANRARVPYNIEHATADQTQKMDMAASELLTLEPYFQVSTVAHASTLDQILVKMRQFKNEHNINVAVVDYAQLIRTPGVGEKSRYDQMAAVSQRLKIAAQELNIAIVLGAQLNREALNKTQNGRPGLHHIADSMDLVRSADVVTFIWWVERHLGGNAVEHWHQKAVLLTPKIRHRPTVLPCIFKYEPQFTNFSILDPNLEQSLREELKNMQSEENSRQRKRDAA